MGKRTFNSSTEKIDCQICGREYMPACDYQQGRCPHHPPLIKGNIMNHKNVSLIKSVIRIAAFCFLAYCAFQEAAVLLIIAESLGILEELV